MIEVKHIDKSFGDKAVLRDINAVFDDGKTNLIIGQSGAGKTVLMKILVGLLDPTGGEVLYDGRDFVRMSKRERVQMRREMGMIFQSAALFDSLSVLENVRFPLDMFSNMTAAERDRRAQECLDRVNLNGTGSKFPGEISGGMQKRVAIARALAVKPKMMLFDEPTSALDPELRHEVLKVMQDLAEEGMTMVIVTHEIGFAEKVASRLIFIDKGRIAEDGNPQELVKNPPSPRLREFLQHVA